MFGHFLGCLVEAGDGPFENSKPQNGVFLLVWGSPFYFHFWGPHVVRPFWGSTKLARSTLRNGPSDFVDRIRKAPFENYRSVR